MITTGFLVIVLFALRLGVPILVMLLLGQALLRRHNQPGARHGLAA